MAEFPTDDDADATVTKVASTVERAGMRTTGDASDVAAKGSSSARNRGNRAKLESSNSRRKDLHK